MIEEWGKEREQTPYVQSMIGLASVLRNYNGQLEAINAKMNLCAPHSALCRSYWVGMVCSRVQCPNGLVAIAKC